MKITNLRAKFQEPPLIKHWWVYDKDELQRVIQANELKLLYFQTSAFCDLGCIYCPTASGKKHPDELSRDERTKVLMDFKLLWWKYVHYIGEGEPLADPDFWGDYEIIKQLDLKLTVFTHGWLLSEKNVKKLKDIDASVMLKYHSHNNTVQDLMANRKGYAEKRNKALQLLLDYWFNSGKETNLGLDILIMRPNYKDIPDYWRYCRDNNIFPMVKRIFFSESADNLSVKNSLNISSEKTKDLFYELSEIDRKEYGYFWIPSPPWAWAKCNYYYYHIFVTNKGSVKPCIWVNQMWNIRERSLESFWNSPEMNTIKNVPNNPSWKCTTCINNVVDKCYGCPCRKVYHHGDGSVEDISKWDNCFSSCGI